MTKPTIRIHNAETDEIIDREMTNAEFKQYELEQEALEAVIAEAEAKAAAKQAIAERLGLTADELAVLLG